jgi:cardiolipin synthase
LTGGDTGAAVNPMSNINVKQARTASPDGSHRAPPDDKRGAPTNGKRATPSADERVTPSADRSSGKRVGCILSGLFDPKTASPSFGECIAQAQKTANAHPALRKSLKKWLFSEMLIALAVTISVTLVVLDSFDGWILVFITALWALFLERIFWVHLGVIRDPQGDLKDRFGLPNGLTSLRLMFIPAMAHYLSGPLAWEPIALYTLIILWVLGMTDFLDGTLARALDQRTAFGRYTDPLTDVLVTSTAALAVWWAGLIPWWLAALVVFRYGGALAGFLLTFTTKGRFSFGPTPIGKICTPTVQMLFFVLVLGHIRPQWALPSHWPQTVTHIVTGLVAFNVLYLVGVLFALNRSKNKSKKKSDEQPTHDP